MDEPMSTQRSGHQTTVVLQLYGRKFDREFTRICPTLPQVHGVTPGHRAREQWDCRFRDGKNLSDPRCLASAWVRAAVREVRKIGESQWVVCREYLSFHLQ
jgi:hypothetical protein